MIEMLIEEYKIEWVQDFLDLKVMIQEALRGLVVDVEHIGSTSVPGLAAKAIIDIDIIYPAEVDFEEINLRLAAIGYYHNGDQGISRREVFKRKKQAEKHPILDTIMHHLYACPWDSEELQRHLLFRDFLRTHAWAREKYQAIKVEIAREAQQDKKAYAQLKEIKAKAFINSLIKLAKSS